MFVNVCTYTMYVPMSDVCGYIYLKHLNINFKFIIIFINNIYILNQDKKIIQLLICMY